MNKHGQTLVLFIILIPMVIMLVAVIVDVGYVTSKKVHIKEVTKTIISDVMNESENQDNIKELFKKNSIDVTNIEIVKNENTLQIKNEIKVDSIFGSIIGIKNYDIKIDITGVNKNNKIVFEY